jgi:hypothetical protein
MQFDAGTTLLVATVAFSGDSPDLDLDRAADELRQAGFEVRRLPKKYWRRLIHQLDDFLEVTCPGVPKAVDTLWNRIEAIVSPHGGLCDTCGLVDCDDYVPFAEDFGELTETRHTLL